MKFSISVVLLLVGVLQVLAAPPTPPVPMRGEEMLCDITKDAVTSDCEKLLSSNFPVHYGGENRTCSYETVWGNARAYNPVCSGKCCIYTTSDRISANDVREYGKMLFQKCKNNGRMRLPGGRTLCISNKDGCEDCFESDG
ncbi:hypothetical protein BD779DRAFT_1672022 [Infundibulicybe gibba]|nr:hypothetical protein BD779DRAFT_1672022 [Infundibulicybe gibba]